MLSAMSSRGIVESFWATMQKNDWADAFLTGDPYAQFLRQEDDRVGKILKDIGLVQ